MKFNDLKSKVKSKGLKVRSKVKSIFDDYHLGKQEFVVTKECRLVLSLISYLLLLALLIMAIGELGYCVYLYDQISNYSYFLKDYSVKSIYIYMILSLILQTVAILLFYYSMDRYRTAEEELHVIEIKASYNWLKISVYLTYILIIALIVLMVKCSNYFYYLCDEFKKSMSSLVLEYMKNLDDKEEMDRLHWNYDCCGADSFKDWLKPPINGSSVPFSCCRKDQIECYFSGMTSEGNDSIFKNGCLSQIIQYLNDLKTGVQYYRLFQMFLIFCNLMVFDIINHSIRSEYLAGTEPVSKFPTLYAVFGLILLIVLYFATFTNYKL